MPQSGGHHLDHLGQHPHRGLGQAGHRSLRGGLEPDGERDGLVVVDHQWWQRRAGGELVAAVHAALRLHRVAEFAQPVDVPAQGTHRDAQPFGQVGAGPVAVGLQ